MVEKNTRICDVCDEHVSKWKCEICEKDICEDCTAEIALEFFNEESKLFGINTCERCKKQFSRVCLSEEEIFEDIMKDKPELKKEIIELIKNVLMLKKISDEDIKEEELPEPILTPLKPNPFHHLPIRPYTNPYDKKKWKKFYNLKTGLPIGQKPVKKKTWWGGIQ